MNNANKGLFITEMYHEPRWEELLSQAATHTNLCNNLFVLGNSKLGRLMPEMGVII